MKTTSSEFTEHSQEQGKLKISTATQRKRTEDRRKCQCHFSTACMKVSFMAATTAAQRKRTEDRRKSQCYFGTAYMKVSFMAAKSWQRSLKYYGKHAGSMDRSRGTRQAILCWVIQASGRCRKAHSYCSVTGAGILEMKSMVSWPSQ